MAGKQSVGGRAAPDGWLAGALGGEDSGLGGGESAPAWSTALLDAVSDAGEAACCGAVGIAPPYSRPSAVIRSLDGAARRAGCRAAAVGGGDSREGCCHQPSRCGVMGFRPGRRSELRQ